HFRPPCPGAPPTRVHSRKRQTDPSISPRVPVLNDCPRGVRALLPPRALLSRGAPGVATRRAPYPHDAEHGIDCAHGSATAPAAVGATDAHSRGGREEAPPPRILRRPLERRAARAP